METPNKPAPGEPRPAVTHIEADSLHEHDPEALAVPDPSPDCGVEISGGGAAGNAVQDIQDLLGEGVVLLPIRRGEKGPLLPGWQHTTIEAMQEAPYREQLGRGNIGVLLGRASGGLCAIDIDADAGVEPFLELNPLLRDTLASKGARGVQLWVKIAGEFPALTKIKTEAGADWGEWRADGGQSVIYGQHPSGVEYRRIKNVLPITVAFDEINWPGDLKLPWLKDASDLLTEQHGPAYAVKAGLQTNDYFFAARYAAEHLVLWEPLEEEFYQYGPEKGLWAVATTDAIKYQLGLDFKRVADETKRDEFLWKRTDGKLSSLVNILRGMVQKGTAFKDRPTAIHFANGMLDLSSGSPVLMSFHPDYYSRNICPIALDPEAECPRFIKELLRSALDEDDIDLLQKWCGGVLLGRNPAEKFLLLTGTAGGGKSTLIEIIEKVIGEQNVAQLRTKFLGERFELHRFLGKTLLTGKDVNTEFLSEQDVELLKALVGNDLLDAEKKHGNEQFQLRGIFNVAITCNSRLRLHLEGDGDAWRRRILIVEYSKAKPEHRITEFGDKLLKEEGAGILNWMVEGAIRYLTEIEEVGDLQMTEVQKNRVELLLQESDSVRQFVQAGVTVSLGSDLGVGEIQQAYLEFCEDRGWRAFSSSDFRSSLPDLMLEIHHVRARHDIERNFKNVRGYKGVALVGGGQ